MSKIDRNPVEKEKFIPEYHLSEYDVQEAQRALVRRVVGSDICDGSGLYGVWSHNDSESNLARSLEIKQFPEMSDVMSAYEDGSVFLMITSIDTKDIDSSRVAHIFRLSVPSYETNGGIVGGIALVDDIVRSNQGVDLASFEDYYSKELLSRSASIESNFRVGERVESEGVSVTDRGYLTIFNFTRRNNIDMLFAHLNTPAIKSLDNLGLEYEPILGSPNIQTPTISDGMHTFDEHYMPVAIPASDHNLNLFSALDTFSIPEIQ